MAVSYRGGYAIAFCAVAVAWLIFCWPWLSGSVTIPYDAKAHFQAQLQFLANALHSGESPFWTPNVFGGSPQIADPQSLIFSPAFLLAYFDATPSFRELDMFAFVLLAAGAFAVLMFFKDRGWHPAGATVAAIAFAFGASAAWRIQHIKQIESYAYFAITLWLLARTLERRSFLYGIATGLAAAPMIMAPGQIALLACYILAGYALYYWLSNSKPWQAFKATLLPLFLGGFLCIALAAIPMILTYLFAAISNRPDVPFSAAAPGSLHPASLLTALVSDLYGAYDPKVLYWGPASQGWDTTSTLSQNMAEIYVGALPIVVILTAGVAQGVLWAREIRVFTIALIASLFYALGANTPVFHILYDILPGVNWFRRPADATFVLGAMLAITAGYIVHRYLTKTIARPTIPQQILQAGLLLAGFLACIAVAYACNAVPLAIKPMAVAAGFTTAALLVIWLIGRLKSEAMPLVIMIVAAFMTFDLIHNNGPNESTGLPAENYDVLRPDTDNATITFLKSKLTEPLPTARRDRVELAGVGFEWPNASMVHGFDHVLGYNPLRLEEITEAIGAEDTIAAPDQRRFTPLFPSYHSLLADMLGLRYIASGVPIEQIDKKLQLGDLNFLARTPDAFIYENPHALPRVLFATDWQRADFAALMKQGNWPANFDPTHTVLLDEEPNLLMSKSYPVQLSSGISDVRIRSYHNTAVEIEVDAARPGFVVLNDVWHPWWFAELDGRPAHIFRANVLFRAVQVPAGHHMVRFEFRPLLGAMVQLSGKLLKAEP